MSDVPMKRTALFFVTLFAVLSARAADVATTYHFSPTLHLEANPIVRNLGAGWPVLLLTNVAAVVVFLLVPLWYYWCGPAKRLDVPPASVWDFTARSLYNRPMSKRRLVATMMCGWPLPRDWRQTTRYFGFTMSWMVVVASWLAVLSWWAQSSWHWQAFGVFRRAFSIGHFPCFELAGALLAGVVLSMVYFRAEHREALRAAA